MNTNVGSKLLLEQLEKAVTVAKENAAEPSVPVILSEPVEKLRVAYERHIDDIFNHGVSRIAEVRHTCDLAEQILKTKRESVVRSFTALLYTMQVVEQKTDEMQSSLGELVVEAEGVGLK